MLGKELAGKTFYKISKSNIDIKEKCSEGWYMSYPENSLVWSSVKLTDRIFEKKYRYFMQLHLGRTVHNTPVHRLLEPGSGSDYGYALYYKMLRYTQIPTDVHVLCSRW